MGKKENIKIALNPGFQPNKIHGLPVLCIPLGRWILFDLATHNGVIRADPGKAGGSAKNNDKGYFYAAFP